MSDMFTWKLVSGEPVRARGVTVTPQARVFMVRLQFARFGFGFAWNRPVAVLVERDGHTQRIPVVDVTRLAQLSIVASGFVVSAIMGRRWRRGKKREEK